MDLQGRYLRSCRRHVNKNILTSKERSVEYNHDCAFADDDNPFRHLSKCQTNGAQTWTMMMDNWKSYRTHVPSRIQVSKGGTDDISGITTLARRRRRKRRLCRDDTLLIGRIEETRRLQQLMHQQHHESHQPCPSREKKKMVLVEGSQGVGKTQLVQSALREAVVAQGGYFVEGKFDSTSQGWPHLGLIQALTDLVDLLAGGKEENARVQELLTEKLTASELSQLSHVLYNLNYLIKLDPGQDENQNEDEKPLLLPNLNSHKLLYLLNSFLQSVQKPVVLFLDDIHWADVETLELIAKLTSDTLLLVGAYNKDYRDDVHNGIQMDESNSIECELLLLENLPLECVVDYLRRMTERQDVEALAQIVHDKTDGNLYYIHEFLDLVQNEGLIWEADTGEVGWNLELLQSRTDKTTNVIDLIESKLQLLPRDTQKVLAVASHLGLIFSLSVLELLSAKMTIKLDLGPALELGLLEVSGKQSYKFSHDRILQIFADLSTDEMKLAVGRFLLEEKCQDLKCLGVKCWNRIEEKGAVLSEKEFQMMAQQNLNVGKIAMSKASLRMASESFEMGLACLGSEEEEPVISLRYELMGFLARTKFLLGHHNEALQLADKIISESSPDSSKHEAYRIKLDSMVGSGLLDEAVKEGCSISTSLGEPLSENTSKITVFIELMRTKKLLAKKSDTELLNQPNRDSPVSASLLNIWGAILIPAYTQKRTNLVGIVSLRTICHSLKYGCTSFTAVAFCVYGNILSRMGNRDESYRFGKLAMRALDLFPSEQLSCRVVASTYCMILHLREHLRCVLDTLWLHYSNGIKSGADLYTLSCGSACLKAGFHCGVNLEELAHGMGEYLSDAARFNKLKAATVVTVEAYHLLVEYLMGDEDLHDVLAKVDVLKAEATSRNDDISLIVIATIQIFRFAFFDAKTEDSVALIRYVEKVYNPQKQTHFLAHFVSFYQAFGMYKHYHRAGGLFVRSEARKFKKRLDVLADDGCINVMVPRRIIEGEELFAQGKAEEAIAVLTDAAGMALDTKLIHMAALAYERAGELLKDMSRRDEARELVSKAADLYTEWGAQEKANVVKFQHYALLAKRQLEQ